MCGLAGVFPYANLSKGTKQKLRQLFLWLGTLNDSRGGHSYGVWGRDMKNHKALGTFASDLDSMASFVRRWKVEGSSWVALHTRYATHGARTVANAHPFEYNNLTLAHNGVLDVNAQIDGSIPTVDSNHLAKYLSQALLKNEYANFEDVFPGVIRNVDGTIGLLMSDQVGNLYAYASSQTLHIAKGNWGCAISSSESHMKDALEASGLEWDTIEQVWDDHLVAPWYANFPDVYAPSMIYVAPKSRKGWEDIKRDFAQSALKGTTTTTTGKAASTESIQDDLDHYYRRPETPGWNYDKNRPWDEGMDLPSGSGIPGVVKLASGEEYPVEEFDGLSIHGRYDDTLGDPLPYEDVEEGDELCELCSERYIDIENPDFWFDQDSGREYIVCHDCYRTMTALERKAQEEFLNAMDEEELASQYSG